MPTNDNYGSPKNALNTTPMKMGHLNIMLLFNVVIIVMIVAYDFLVASWREASGRPIFLEGTFGLSHTIEIGRAHV